MARRFYAHEYPKIPKGCPWVSVIVYFQDGKRARGSYHPNGCFYANGADVTKQIKFWEYE